MAMFKAFLRGLRSRVWGKLAPVVQLLTRRLKLLFRASALLNRWTLNIAVSGSKRSSFMMPSP